MSGEHPSSVSGVFRRPSSEQVAYFRRKLGRLVPTQRWDDMLGAAHDDGFMVAGATKADLLTDLGAAVDRAITEGKSLDAFRKDFRSIVAKHGWTGWTGEGSVRGEAWRVKVIYSTNAYTSYAAGRFAQLQAGKFPFWVYRHGGSLEPREQHLSWDGLVLEPDHPFWRTHYPPSDWGCSCYALGARSESAAKRLGGDPAKTLPANWNAVDPKTGAPVGIGRGWNYAPGASVSELVQAMAGKVRHWDHAVAKAFMQDLPPERADALSDAYRSLPSTADDARRYAQRVLAGTDEGTADMAPLPPVRTLGLVRSEQAGQLGREMEGVGVSGFDFSLDPFAIQHVRKEHGDPKTEASRGQRVAQAEDYARLPQLLNLAGSYEDAGKSWRTGNPLVKLVRKIGGETWIVVFEVRTGRKSLALDSLVIAGVSQP